MRVALIRGSSGGYDGLPHRDAAMTRGAEGQPHRVLRALVPAQLTCRKTGVLQTFHPHRATLGSLACISQALH